MTADRKQTSAWALLLFALAFLANGIPVAHAAAANCSATSFVYRYTGVGRNPAGARASGAQANVEVRESALCTPPAGKDARAGGFAGLFQAGGGGFTWIGWDRSSSSGRNGTIHVTQDGSVDLVSIIGAITVGTVLKYKTVWQNGSDGFIRWIFCASNGSNCTDAGHTSFQGSVWTDIQGRVAGWTSTSNSDVPGIVANHADYTAIMWRDGTGTWQTASSTSITSGVSRYHLSVISNSNIQTWTDPL